MFHLRNMLQKTGAETFLDRWRNKEKSILPWHGPELVSLAHIETSIEANIIKAKEIVAQPALTSLQKSIRAVQLTSPLYLMQTRTDSFLIMSGFNRFRAMASINIEQANAFIIEQEQAHAVDCLLFWIYENIGQRQLDLFEKAFFIELMRSLSFNYASIADLGGPDIGLPAHAPLLAQYHQVIQLPHFILKSFAQGQITEFQTVTLAALPRHNRKPAFASLQTSRWNNKEFATFINLVREVSEIEQIPFNQILQDIERHITLRRTDMNKREKGMNLLSTLKKRRYPQLTNHEQKFTNILRKARIPPGLSIQPPLHFEGSVLRIMLTAAKPDDIKKIISKLQQMLDDETFQNLFELL